MRFIVLILLVFSRFCAEATELMPWFGAVKELELRSQYTFQNYHEVKTGNETQHYYSSDHFLNLSASTAATDSIAGEFEIDAGKTSQRHFQMDDERLTIRMMLMNDIIGDPLSISAGFTFTHAHRPALQDISTPFYHGKYNYEGHLALGQESICEQYWTSRWWGVFGIGVASQGSPWLRSNLEAERNFWDVHRVGIFAHSLWGLGNETLDLAVPFQGYGPINHQTIDVGFRYRYFTENDASLNFEYARRVYAKNAPSNANIFLVSLIFQLGFEDIPGIGYLSFITKAFNPLK